MRVIDMARIFSRSCTAFSCQLFTIWLFCSLCRSGPCFPDDLTELLLISDGITRFDQVSQLLKLTPNGMITKEMTLLPLLPSLDVNMVSCDSTNINNKTNVREERKKVLRDLISYLVRIHKKTI